MSRHQGNGAKAPEGPAWALYANERVGRVVLCAENERRGVVRAPKYFQPDKGITTYRIEWQGPHEMADVPSCDVHLWMQFAFEDPSLFVPSSILQLQRDNWQWPLAAAAASEMMQYKCQNEQAEVIHTMDTALRPGLQSVATTAAAATVGGSVRTRGIASHGHPIASFEDTGVPSSSKQDVTPLSLTRTPRAQKEGGPLRTGVVSNSVARKVVVSADIRTAPAAAFAAGTDKGASLAESASQAEAAPAQVASTSADSSSSMGQLKELTDATKKLVANRLHASDPSSAIDGALATEVVKTVERRNELMAAVPSGNVNIAAAYDQHDFEAAAATRAVAGTAPARGIPQEEKELTDTETDAAGSYVLCKATNLKLPANLCCGPSDRRLDDIGTMELVGKFVVEYIMDEIFTQGRWWYLVKWVGYELNVGSVAKPKGDWEPFENVQHDPRLHEWCKERPIWFTQQKVPPIDEAGCLRPALATAPAAAAAAAAAPAAPQAPGGEEVPCGVATAGGTAQAGPSDVQEQQGGRSHRPSSAHRGGAPARASGDVAPASPTSERQVGAVAAAQPGGAAVAHSSAAVLGLLPAAVAVADSEVLNHTNNRAQRPSFVTCAPTVEPGVVGKVVRTSRFGRLLRPTEYPDHVLPHTAGSTRSYNKPPDKQVLRTSYHYTSCLNELPQPQRSYTASDGTIIHFASRPMESCLPFTPTLFKSSPSVLENLSIPGYDLTSMSHYSLCCGLITLDLNNCQFLTDITALGKFTALRDLNLSYCFSIPNIAPLQLCQQLRSLQLKAACCKVELDVSPLASCQLLQDLDLDLTTVTSILPLLNCTKLKNWTMASCRGIPASQLEQMQAAFGASCLVRHDVPELHQRQLQLLLRGIRHRA